MQLSLTTILGFENCENEATIFESGDFQKHPLGKRLEKLMKKRSAPTILESQLLIHYFWDPKWMRELDTPPNIF